MKKIRRIYVWILIACLALPTASYLASDPNKGKFSGGFRYKTFRDDELWGDTKQTSDSVYFVSAWVKNSEGRVASSAIVADYASAMVPAKAGTDYYSMNSYYTKW
ncbi:MAG: hypothetical protein ACRCUP_06330 [Mycoplasmatales bacterium]